MALPDPKWQEVALRAPKYIPRDEHTAHSMTLCGSKIWFLGGLQAGRAVPSAVYALDLITEKWLKVDFPKRFSSGGEPLAVFGQSGTLVDSRIIFIGGLYGIQQSSCPSKILVFDVVLQQYEAFATYGAEQRGGIVFHSAHFLCDTEEIVVFGGKTADGNFAQDPLFSLGANSFAWTKLPWRGTAPAPRGNHGSCLVDRKVYIFGGFGPQNVVYNDMHILNLTHRVASFSQPKAQWNPAGRFGTFVFHYCGQIYMFGGKTAPFGDMNIRLHDLWRFNIAKQTWYECETYNRVKHPSRKANHRGLMVNKRALIFGGTKASLRNRLEIQFG